MDLVEPTSTGDRLSWPMLRRDGNLGGGGPGRRRAGLGIAPNRLFGWRHQKLAAATAVDRLADSLRRINGHPASRLHELPALELKEIKSSTKPPPELSTRGLRRMDTVDLAHDFAQFGDSV